MEEMSYLTLGLDLSVRLVKNEAGGGSNWDCSRDRECYKHEDSSPVRVNLAVENQQPISYMLASPFIATSSKMSTDRLSLANKAAIVTGSGRENGIDAAIALALARPCAGVRRCRVTYCGPGPMRQAHAFLRITEPNRRSHWPLPPPSSWAAVVGQVCLCREFRLC
ncbi:uncharacterized protein LY79DRAFT_541507 [Colletotrichum navitas]|uniref:Uncharacterized protein n=1 Tax=Colletotrichum navitas TaxID=681940 RepID=A0AAD8Q838_9PEZI|nr:uncharacterized protein LY79DRAFT_541507 [Colletotrichum navitas]KAK1597384.1 hypothetical protein LY79DRAFT_541507 [Colletotrichum navitas]